MRAIWPGALLVVYLAATGVLLITGPGRVGGGAATTHIVLLLAAAAATWVPQTPRWARSWMPLLLLVFLYSEMPALIRAAGHVYPLDAQVIAWEEAVFGMQPARVWARELGSPVLSETLHLAYLSYYGIIYVVPAQLWLSGRREEFDSAVFALLLTFVACFVCYIVFPVMGPRYFWPSAAPDGVFRSAATFLLEARSSAGTAFPSSHVTVSVAQSVLAARFFGARGGVAIAVLTIALALGAVYGGFHYAVDVIAGAPLGALVAFAGLKLMDAASGQAKATAPTYSGSER